MWGPLISYNRLLELDRKYILHVVFRVQGCLPYLRDYLTNSLRQPWDIVKAQTLLIDCRWDDRVLHARGSDHVGTFAPFLKGISEFEGH